MELDALQGTVRNHVQQIIQAEEAPACLSNVDISKSINLDVVVESIHPSHDKSSVPLHRDIILLETYLHYSEARHEISTLQHVQQWAANAILPGEVFAEKAPYSIDGDSTPDLSEIRRLRAMYLSGLKLLRHLQRPRAVPWPETAVEALLCLSSFTDPLDPWTSQETFEEANLLLGQYLNVIRGNPKKLNDLLTRLLQEKIKPLFAKSKSKNITAQGRKAIRPPPGPFVPSDLEATNKPWKYHDVYVVTAFKWVLEQLDALQIEANWPLIIPPLLALIDDVSTTYKIRGCELLVTFLKAAPSQILERTGLGEVFQNTLMPCLLYLPTLTPEDESLRLLDTVYPTLTALVNARFTGDKDRASRMKAFDQILRYGVFKGYAHAGENVTIAKLLVKSITDLVNEMGIASVKHLKHLLPLLSGILTAPFALAYPPLLLAAVQALNAVIVNDWPRITYHRGEILEGLITCWCSMQDEESLSTDLQTVLESIAKTVNILTDVVLDSVDMSEECRLLVDSDSRLQKLMVIYER